MVIAAGVFIAGGELNGAPSVICGERAPTCPVAGGVATGGGLSSLSRTASRALMEEAFVPTEAGVRCDGCCCGPCPSR